MATKKKIEDSEFIVTAPFELDGKQYGEGDVFTPHAGMVLDEAFTEFRNLDRKKGATAGLAFSKPGEIIDAKTGERASRMFVLPLVVKE